MRSWWNGISMVSYCNRVTLSYYKIHVFRGDCERKLLTINHNLSCDKMMNVFQLSKHHFQPIKTLGCLHKVLNYGRHVRVYQALLVSDGTVLLISLTLTHKKIKQIKQTFIIIVT